MSNKGVAFANLNRHEEAIGWYDKALEIHPNDVLTLFNKGQALRDMGKFEEAIALYDKVLAVDPQDIDALINKGGALSQLGRNEEAISSYDEILAIDPSKYRSPNSRDFPTEYFIFVAVLFGGSAIAIYYGILLSVEKYGPERPIVEVYPLFLN